MNGINDPIMAEMRRIKESKLEKHGSWENFNKYLDDQRSILEAQGWHFETEDERTARLICCQQGRSD